MGRTLEGMTRRRLEALEWAAGVGRAAWAEEARHGLRVFSRAAQWEDPEALPDVRRAFAVFRASYTPGAGLEELDAAVIRLVDSLEAALSPDAFGVATSSTRARNFSKTDPRPRGVRQRGPGAGSCGPDLEGGPGQHSKTRRREKPTPSRPRVVAL